MLTHSCVRTNRCKKAGTRKKKNTGLNVSTCSRSCHYTKIGAKSLEAGKKRNLKKSLRLKRRSIKRVGKSLSDEACEMGDWWNFPTPVHILCMKYFIAGVRGLCLENLQLYTKLTNFLYDKWQHCLCRVSTSAAATQTKRSFAFS